MWLGLHWVWIITAGRLGRPRTNGLEHLSKPMKRAIESGAALHECSSAERNIPKNDRRMGYWAINIVT